MKSNFFYIFFLLLLDFFSKILGSKPHLIMGNNHLFYGSIYFCCLTALFLSRIKEKKAPSVARVLHFRLTTAGLLGCIMSESLSFLPRHAYKVSQGCYVSFSATYLCCAVILSIYHLIGSKRRKVWLEN